VTEILARHAKEWKRQLDGEGFSVRRVVAVLDSFAAAVHHLCILGFASLSPLFNSRLSRILLYLSPGEKSYAFCQGKTRSF
jgi:hypothetical protein